MLKYWETNGIKDSFSKNHTMPYSGICIQEMNLADKFDKIYWNTSCLTVNAGADEENEHNKNTQYGKIAKAIGEIQKRGQQIALPNINKAKFGFIPDIENQEIIFGLKGICGIGDDDANFIVKNQPYKNFEDFLFKNEIDKTNKIGNSAIITLIKAGAFDRILNKNRKEIMIAFIGKVSEPLTDLKIEHILILYRLNLLSKEQIDFELRIYKFRKYIYNKSFISKQEGKSDSTIFYRLPNTISEAFFYEHFETYMTEDKDYCYDTNGNICIKKGSLDREYKKLLTPFKQFIQGNTILLDAVNKERFDNLWLEKAAGTIAQWEMESLSFYHSSHELEHVKKEDYLITEFDQLPTIPAITEYYTYRGKERPRFKLDRICGTVLDRDKNKQLVTILTPSDVVTIKFYKGQFGFYDKQISEVNEEGKKTILEKSWFTRGNKLLITGFRREDKFIPKKYIDSAYRHTLQLIKDIDTDGNLILVSEREGETQ